jgi:methylthioxylose transferase
VRRATTILGAAAWLLAATILVVSIWWGRNLQVDRPEIQLGAAPLVGEDPADGWDWRFSWSLVGAAVVGAFIVVCVARGWWWRWSVRTVLVVTAIATGAFATLLGLADGRAGILRGADHRTEYLVNLEIAPPAGEFLRTFVDELRGYSVHIRGHPPGFLLLLMGFDWVGLDGPWPVVGLSILATALLPVAVLLTVRTVAGEDWVRRAAPALIVSPYLIWMVTSADAVFAACGAFGVAAIAKALAATPRGAVTWGLLAGVLFGALLFMTYGGVTYALIPAVPVGLALRERRPGAFYSLGATIVGVAGVTVAFAAFGFWWLDGARATRRQYWLETAGVRPADYFMVANLGAALIAIGLLGFAGLTRFGRQWRTAPAFWPYLVGGALALVASHVSQMTKAEVERIWLLFFPWLLLGAATVVVRSKPYATAGWIAVQATTAIVLEAALVTKW